MMMTVQEMFFYVHVSDIERAETFYVNALGAEVDFSSPTWSSLVIAGVRVNLVLRENGPAWTGMNFIVDDVALACAAVAQAGGDVAPGVETSHAVIAEVFDSEGNTFTLRQPRAISNAEVASQAA